MWVKIDDQFPDHPKVVAAGPAAAWMYICGLCYCNRMLTDGFIPLEQVDKLLPHTQDRPIEEFGRALAAKLCRMGLWDEADRKGLAGFRIHDYLDFQPSRKQVLTERARGASRQQRFKAKRNGKGNAVSNRHGNAEGNAVTNEPVTPAPYPVSRIPKEEEKRPEVGQPRVELEPVESIRWFDKVYAAYPNKDRKMDANRAWVTLAPDVATSAAMLNDIQGRVKAGWKRFERRFIPNLATYLRDRMWEDEAAGADPIYEDDPYANLPHAWTCQACGQVHEGTAAQHTRGVCLKERAS